MSRIRSIPKRYKTGFELLWKMSDTAFTVLYKAIISSPLTFSPVRLADTVSSSVVDLTQKEVRNILTSVGSLIPLIERERKTSDKVIEEITEVIKEEISKSNESSLDESDEGRFKQALETLIGCEQLYYAAKSVDLITEAENIFISAKTVADIRPIFSADVSATPKAGMIVHTLHLHFHFGEEAEHRDIYMAMDGNDIKALKAVIERAEAKGKSLEGLLNKTGMTKLTQEDRS